MMINFFKTHLSFLTFCFNFLFDPVSQKKLLRFLISVQFFLFILGCAFNNSKDEIHRRESRKTEEKNQILRDTFNKVTGFYQGTLRLSQSVREVSLGVYTLDVNDGFNSVGEPIFKPVLKAVFRQLYPVEMPVVLDGSYNSETFDLTFVTTEKNSSFDTIQNIDSKFLNPKIQGIVKTPTGELGTLDLTFVNKQVDVPVDGDEDQIADKMREQFSLVTGTYLGRIQRQGTNSEPKKEWKIELGLYVVDVLSGTTPTGEPKIKPVLKARFKQISPVSPNLILDVSFNFDSNEFFLFHNGTNLPNAPDSLATLNAIISGRKITGTASKASGYWGDVILDFYKKEVDTPTLGEQEDYYRRLEEEFKPLVGQYSGRISPHNSDPIDVKVNINIYLEETPTGNVPKLKANYIHANDKQRATQLFMNVIYKTEFSPAELEIVGQRQVGSITYYVSLTGIFQNKTIEGTYINQTGRTGPFKLVRKK